MTSWGRTVCVSGERCRRLREARGLTREALAQASRGADALSLPTIKRAESGQAIYLSSAASLARLLDVSVSDLMPAAKDEAERTVDTHQASIAALPFETPEPTEDCRVFADGLVDDLTSRLSTYWFPVIARSSSFSVRGKALKPREIGDRLGADYLVEGSVRRSGARIRVNARLVESRGERQIWADTYETAAGELFQNQDFFCFHILGHVGNRVLSWEAERAKRRPIVDQDAWQLAMRGAWHFYRSTPADNRRARDLMRQALAIDESLALAHYVLVLSLEHDLLNQWADDAEATRREMRCHSRQFERLVPDNPWMHVAAAYSCVAHGERSEAMHRLQEALQLDPNSVAAHSLYGQTLAMSSLPDQGLHELGLARTLSPRDSGIWAILLMTALAHFGAGRYAECVDWATQAVRNRPQIPMCYAALAAGYACLGETTKARETLAQMRLRDGALRLRGFQPLLGATDRELSERFLSALRVAGLPDQ